MKKGFTLIELLAVIIILAIVAVIATPMVLNVVDDAKNSARESKLKMYADNVKLKAEGNYFSNNGNIDGEIDTSLLNNSSTSCEKSYYTDGKIYLSNCTVDGVNGLYYVNGTIETSKPSNYDDLVADLYSIEAMSNKILTKYPYLTLANTEEKGCAINNDNNYTYMGGCYLKGLQTENYVWFNGFMYRLMGINSDGSIKLITEENIAAIPISAYGVMNDYNSSYIKKWLNEYFLTHTNSTLNNALVNGNFCFGVATTTTTSNTTCAGTILNDKVGQLSIDEYSLAGANSSYLKNGQGFWTITPYDNIDNWAINIDGDFFHANTLGAYGIRAIINIEPSTTITFGDGNINSYYVLGERKNITIGTISNAKVGEYVIFADKTYRILENTESGIKLVLDGYYNQDLAYGTIGDTLPTCTLCANNDILNYLVAPADTNNINKLKETNWHLGNAMLYGEDYSVKSLASTNSYSKTFGFMRMGEILTGQSETILNPIENGTRESNNNRPSNAKHYWLATPYNGTYAWFVSHDGFATGEGFPGYTSVGNIYGVRPVVNINEITNIIGGKGTPMSPYQI